MDRDQNGKSHAAQRTSGPDDATTPTGAKVRTGWWQGVVTLAVAVAVAAMAAYGVISLQDDAERARESQYVLASLEADVFRALHLQDRAVHDEDFGPELEQELRATLTAGESKVGRLEQLDAHAHGIDPAFAEFRRGVEDSAGAVRAGDHEEAHRIEEARVDPAVARVAQVIDGDLVEHGRKAERADELADKGSVGALGLAALVISGLTSLHRCSRRRAERLAIGQGALLVSERRFRSLVQHSSDMITIVDADLVPVYNTPSVERVLGYADADLGATAKALARVHPDDEAGVRARLFELVGAPQGHSAPLAYRMKHRDGRWRHVETVATNLLDEPTIAGVVLNSRDVSERAALEGELTHRALHDPLTELANRALFRDRVEPSTPASASPAAGRPPMPQP